MNAAGRPLAELLGRRIRDDFVSAGIVDEQEAELVSWSAIGEVARYEVNAGLGRGAHRLPPGSLRHRVERAVR